MTKNFSYNAPAIERPKSTLQDHKWDEVTAAYEKKEYDKIIPTMLEYANPAFIKYKKDNKYSIPHGSVIIDIIQTDKKVIIELHFLNIKNAKKVPLMRKMAELKQNPLNMATITLKNDEVVFYFSCPLELCEPYKIYNVFREICFNADVYDDEFIQKFGAEWILQPKVQPLSEEAKAETYTKAMEIINEGITTHDKFMSDRNGTGAWYALNITLKKLDYYANAQGFYRTEIERAVNILHDKTIPFSEVITKGKSRLKHLASYSKEDFCENLYKIEVFIPYKYSISKDAIRKNWESVYKDVLDIMKTGSQEQACMMMVSTFYNCYYNNNLDKNLDHPIKKALHKSSGQSYHVAAPMLLDGMRSIMEDNYVSKYKGMEMDKAAGNQSEGGLLKKLFGGFFN